MVEGIRQQERDTLRHIIQQWNSNRLDLFEISEPDENLEFHGVMRFYFQDSGQKVATKCIRVPSGATTKQVIETLIEKFRPDMRMLSIPEYTLYEIHENGEERRLADDEKPLLVQLNWNRDDREGRFLLRGMDLNGVLKTKSLPPIMSSAKPPASKSASTGGETSFIRKLSKREKKELKKQEKLKQVAENQSNSVAEKLYTELPETSFTRSISNPEAVMRRQRAQKLEKRLLEFRSKNGGPDTGGTLKIYGMSLCPDVPYKTLLLSVRDTAASVVKEMLEKYGLHKEDPTSYCLVQCIVTEEEVLNGYQGQIVPQREYILDDDECPLSILMNHSKARGAIMFQVRRRPLDHGQRRRKKKPVKGSGPSHGAPHHQHSSRHQHSMDDLMPFLVELGPDGNDLGKGLPHRLQANVTEVGSERVEHSGAQALQLFGGNIHPSHCVITQLDGVVTVTPSSPNAETYVNFKRIYETTILQHGAVIRFGRSHTFRFMDPHSDDRTRLHMSPQPHQVPPLHLPPQHRHVQQLPQKYPSERSVVQEQFAHVLPSNVSAGGAPGAPIGSQFASRASSIAGSQTSIARPSGTGRPNEHWANVDRNPPARDPILPAVLEFPEEMEDTFLHSIITQLDPTDIQFKLAPTYTLYMAARFRASTHYRPDLSPPERAQKLTVVLKKVATIIHEVLEYKQNDATSLAFWMANASELLHFLKQDRHICGYSLDAQDILAEAVQFAFRKLVDCMQMELSASMPLLLEDRDDKDEEEGATIHILSLFTNTMSLLRMCRVNAALTIQLFSQLFHYINMWVFNKIVTENCPNYCSRMWGERIKIRVGRIESWAEKRGLELATDCHLAKLSQAAMLLMSSKGSLEDVASLSSACFKLNSLQLREILEKYQLAPGEPPIPRELIDSVVSVAETTADGLSREDGREVRLEEDADLQLPFLLPEDGYSCDVVRGVPSGLAEFLDPLQRGQLCCMTPQPTSAGFWTIYMHNHQEIVGGGPRPSVVAPGPRSASAMSNRSFSVVPRGEPEVHTIELQKFKSGMGLSIVATKGENQDHLGIYIKSVVPGGAADMDGRLQAGDQLLSVDGKSLVGISQEEAAQYMVGTGSVVTLEVARQGALFHGLAPLLSQPSPQVPRGGNLDQYRDAMGGGVHSHPHHQSMQHYPPHSGHPSHPGYHSQMHKPPLSSSHHHHHHHHHPMVNHHYQASRIQPSKSVPALNSDANAMMTRKSESHDVINPSFSVGSSVSLSQLPPHQQPVRSRSTQNLNEGGPLALSGRHPSTPALNGEEDRHYQNVSFHQGHQDPRMGSQRGGRPPIFDHQRPASQQAMMRPGDPRLTLPLGEDPRKRFSGASTTSPVGSPGFTAGIHRPPPPFARGNPRYTSSHGVVPPHLPSPHGYLPHSPAGSPMSHVPPMVSPHYPSPSSHSAPLVASGPLKHPPPTAPKPQRNSGSNFPSEAVSSPHSEHPHGRMIPSAILRPTSLDESFRDSPPPPPPPTSTHPLLQGGLKGGPQSGTPTKPGFLKSPWQRDEKEKYQIRKREAARRWRDEQISALESLSSRSVQEEEMLKTLRLEREFQKRAEAQSKEDDDEEEEGVDDAEEEEGGEGEAEENEQQPREPGNRKSWSSGNVPMGGVSSLAKSEREELSVIGGGVSRLVKDDFRSKSSNAHHQLTKSSVVSNGGISTPEVGNKVEEIRRKQLELEVAQRTEERLLQRVHQRQEEQQHLSQVIMGGVEDTHHRVSSSHQRHQASQRLDTLVGSSVPPQRIVNGGNIGPNRIYPPGIGGSSSPLPPERGSSFAVMNQHVSPDPSSTVKRVQFSPHSPSDESSKITYDDNANHQKASSFSSPTPHHDPDDFINEAETLMNSSVANKPTGGTPGVIGAQEVYRDPRQRRLHEQAQRAAAGQARPGPEKLTFREKMKMFAREAEQGGE